MFKVQRFKASRNKHEHAIQRQIEDAVSFPVPAFSGFHKGHTNKMNTQTKFFSHIKQQAVLVRNVPGLCFYYLSTIFAEYIYVSMYKYIHNLHFKHDLT